MVAVHYDNFRFYVNNLIIFVREIDIKTTNGYFDQFSSNCNTFIYSNEGFFFLNGRRQKFIAKKLL